MSRNQGRGSGLEVEWEAWNLWVSGNGKLIRMEQLGTREQAIEAANRLHHD